MPARILLVLLAFASLSTCSLEELPGPSTATQTSELRVPGPWAPPASTRSIAATQYVSVVDPPAVAPLGSCSSTNAFDCSCTHPECTRAHPGTVELDRFLRNKYPYLSSGGLYCCRQNSARTSVPKLSVHAVGRAIDLMVPMDSSDADNGLGDPVANWLVENAEFIGVQRVIWDKAYWNGERGFGLLSSNSSPHVNHIHLELSTAGAYAQTPFFTSGASNGTCTPACDGTRLINANCTSTNCATSGTECLPENPPRCGTPPPPEPPEAAAVSNPTRPTINAVGAPSRLTYTTPRRLFDSRDDKASSRLTRGGGGTTGPLTAQDVSTYQDTSLPDDASALWLNLAAVPQTDPGFIIGFPTGSPQPEVSHLNYAPGFVRANAAPILVGNNKSLELYSRAEVHLIADMNAVFSPTGDGLTTEGPTRVYDTRSEDRPLEAEGIRKIDVRAPAGATGVVGTMAIIGGTEAGFATVFPCGQPVPDTSSINHGATSVHANTIVSALGDDNAICVWSLKEAHAIFDVTGYLSPTAQLSYQPVSPQRLLDTRSSTTFYEGRLGPRQVIELPIQSLPGMPEGVWSAVVNFTSLGSTEAGHLTAFPCGGSVPSTSSLNFKQGAGAIAALSVSPVGQNGKLCVFASTRTHLIADLLGVWVHTGEVAPPDPPDNPDPGDQGEPEDPGEFPGEDVGGTEDTGTSDDTGGSLAEAPSFDTAQGEDGSGAETGPTPAATADACECSSLRGHTPRGTPWGLLLAFGFLGMRYRRREGP